MINVTKKYCENSKCLFLPSFNYIGEKTPRFCSGHKLTGMISLTHDYCIFKNN
jgi:hypothetical protein